MEKKQERNRKIKKLSVLALAGVLLWLLVIFGFSAQPVEESVGLSRKVGMLLARWFQPGFADWDAARQTAFVQGMDFALRKTAHFLEYMVLGMLLGLTLAEWIRRPGWRLAAGTAVAALFAAGDEFHQLFVSGRTSRWQDVCIDTAGALLGLGILFLLKKRKRKVQKK